jgi:hypothetical protein
MNKKLLVSLLCVCLVTLGFELWLRSKLFSLVSYSSSESIDRQLGERNKQRARWTLIFIGDSETRWGIVPSTIDQEMVTSSRAKIESFNHSFDGFGAGWWPALLPSLFEHESLSQLKYVALGVQMTEVHRQYNSENAECGSLQRPVLTSSFGIDSGYDRLCRLSTWDAKLGRAVFDLFWTVKYASAVKSLLMPAWLDQTNGLRSNSRRTGSFDRGFEGHRSSKDDLNEVQQETGRWLKQFQPSRDFKPLPRDEWPRSLSENGYFDSLKKTVERRGAKLILFALPTNPFVIDTFNRRSDYIENSKALGAWSISNGVVFIDLGIEDVADPETHFSDVRHLSETGAKDYSSRLGRALANKLDTLEK